MTNTAPNTLINFDSESDLENFSVSEGSTVTWIADNPYKMKVGGGGSNDIELTDGVVKVDYSGSTSHSFSFKLPNSLANYKDYNYVSFYMVFNSGTSQIGTVAPQNCGDYVGEYMNNGDTTAWVENQTSYCLAWTFKIGNFLDNDTVTVNLKSAGTGAGTYYISDIYVSKDITNANLDVTINDDIRGNVEYYQSVKAGDMVSTQTAINYSISTGKGSGNSSSTARITLDLPSHKDTTNVKLKSGSTVLYEGTFSTENSPVTIDFTAKNNIATVDVYYDGAIAHKNMSISYR